MFNSNSMKFDITVHYHNNDWFRVHVNGETRIRQWHIKESNSTVTEHKTPKTHFFIGENTIKDFEWDGIWTPKQHAFKLPELPDFSSYGIRTTTFEVVYKNGQTITGSIIDDILSLTFSFDTNGEKKGVSGSFLIEPQAERFGLDFELSFTTENILLATKYGHIKKDGMVGYGLYINTMFDLTVNSTKQFLAGEIDLHHNREKLNEDSDSDLFQAQVKPNKAITLDVDPELLLFAHLIELYSRIKYYLPGETVDAIAQSQGKVMSTMFVSMVKAIKAKLDSISIRS